MQKTAPPVRSIARILSAAILTVLGFPALSV
jgi:hypothetical protein